MDNKQRIKCLFGYHNWIYLTTKGDRWLNKIRCCQHCKKEHPIDSIVFRRLWGTWKKGGVK